MDEEAKKAQEAAEAAKRAEEQKKADEAKNQKTFTQEDFDKQLSKTLAEKEAKLEKKLADKLKAEREEWERQAKLSAEEKEAEERKKREQETAAKERDITLRENRADARELLAEKNIPTTLVDFVVDVDADKTKENIDTLEKAYLEAVEKGVADKLKGDTPKDKSNNTGADVPKYSGTTVL